jgi:hypothetical protein
MKCPLSLHIDQGGGSVESSGVRLRPTVCCCSLHLQLDFPGAVIYLPLPWSSLSGKILFNRCFALLRGGREWQLWSHGNGPTGWQACFIEGTLLRVSVYSWEKWDWEKFCNLLEVLWWVSGPAGVWCKPFDSGASSLPCHVWGVLLRPDWVRNEGRMGRSLWKEAKS